MKPESNDPCPCGSGKIFENCCQKWYEAAKSKPSLKKTAPTATECNELVALLDAGHLTELENRSRLLLEQYPGSGFVWNLLGTTLRMQGKDCLPALQKATEFSPNDIGAHIKLGSALNDLGRLDEAEASYRHALWIDRHNAEAHCNLGITLKDMGRLDEAETCFRQALWIKPDFAEAHNNLGVVLSEKWRYEDAIACLRKALAIKPDYAHAYNTLGYVLGTANRHEEAVACFKKLLSIEPDHAFASGMHLQSKMYCCNWEGIDDIYRELLGDINAGKAVLLPFFFLSTPSTLAQQKRCAEIFIRENHLKTQTPSGAIGRYSHGKIRLGYFSSDFYEHATTQLMSELLERHDRSRFEVIGFSFGASPEDNMRQRVSAAFDRFIDVRNRSDKEIASLARDIEIDIAVDLKGYTTDCRTGIFALRPAPIQVSYLGYPGTMCAPFIDYLIADPTLIPVGHQQYYSEKIVYLPDTYQVNDSHKRISERQFSRSEAGLPDEGFVFCCFNNNYKITPTVFDIWMQLLKQIDGSVLWLLEGNAEAAQNLQNEAMKRGIAPERLVFAARMSLPDHLARHRLADLFIDTFFYNAHTTASDALWAGLPVLTYLGDTFAGRVAASLLNAIGLPGLITHSHEEYKALALELAENPEKLARIKQQLAKNRLTHPLFDTALFTRHIEDAYTLMWKRHQASLLPDHIYVNK